jgi:protein involved in polysaccharide export with SLBB domain
LFLKGLNVMVRHVRHVRHVARTLALGALFFVTGCVQYVATGPERLSPGDEVRLTLAPNPESRLRAPSGRPLESIQGRAVGFTPVGDSLQVRVPWGPVVGVGAGQVGERFVVTLHPSEVLAAERKTISRSRTALAAFGISAVATSLFRSVARDRRSGRGGEEEPVAPPVEF